jgi:hypothetical protein
MAGNLPDLPEKSNHANPKDSFGMASLSEGILWIGIIPNHANGIPLGYGLHVSLPEQKFGKVIKFA